MRMQTRSLSAMKLGAKAILIAMVFCLSVFKNVEGASPQGSCFVTVSGGDVQGAPQGSSCAFLGIPYAASTAGNNRWRPPQPAAPWAPSILQATAPSINCAMISAAGTPAGSENCLRLNVWVSDPPPNGPAPVLVVLHTGAFTGAGANFVGHNGAKLAAETGVIVVAPFYRLGAFGFLAHQALIDEDPGRPTSGNYGLLDQRAALEWVRDNIAQFGGDPQNVTLTGTSAGGQSVLLHMISPDSAGLFHRAIIESAHLGTSRAPTIAEAVNQGDALANALGCTDPVLVLSCMRSKSQNQIVTALSQATQQVVEPPGRVYWEPVVDGLVIPDQPRILFEKAQFHRVPTIVGIQRDEGWGFVGRSFPSGVTPAQYENWAATEFGVDADAILSLYPAADFPSPADAMARVVGDLQFVCETRRLARSIERTGTPVFEYSYEYELDDISLDHVTHGVEQFIIFGNDYVVGPVSPVNHVLTAADLLLHGSMAGYWSRFAATGNPNVEDDSVVHWPAFKHPAGQGRASDKYLVFDSVIAENKRLREEQCDFFEPFFFRSTIGGIPASAP